jgi:hypothetical protein
VMGPDWIKAAGLFMKVEALAADAAMYKSLSLTPSQIGQKLRNANNNNKPGVAARRKVATKARKAAKSGGL